MTIALLIKVNDGLVLASDSATTLTMLQPDGTKAFANVYNNANKVFNLHKGLPIGAMTWGLGNIGSASIATLAKDLRRRFQGEDADHMDSSVDLKKYEVKDLASLAKKFLYEERYLPIEKEARAAGQDPPLFGFLVAGYSSGTEVPLAFVMNFGNGEPPKIDEVIPDEAGAAWWGQPEAIARILSGMSLAVPDAINNLRVGLSAEEATQLVAAVRPQLNPQMVTPAMPIQDAIELAEFLVHATIQYVRFSPGAPTVGGPIEIATITKYEGFKWVRRKHFFDSRLNPS